MKQITLFAFTILCSILLFCSCQKQLSLNSDENKTLSGTWKLIDISANTLNIVEVSDGIDSMRTESTSNYTTTDNQGTLTIDASKMTTNAMAYSIADTVTAIVYLDGVLTDSTSLPFSASVPPSSGSSSYKLIGTDSVYFPGGAPISVGSTIAVTTPAGARMNVKGDTLTMTVSLAVKGDPEVTSGVTTTNSDYGTMIVTFRKQ